MENVESFVGDVIWFDPKKGFGFISWSKDDQVQKDLFVHFSDVESEGFKTLYKGQKVSFSLGVNKHGVPKAVNVIVLKQ